MKHAREVVRAFEQGKAYFKCQQQVQYVAAELKVALQVARYAYTRKAQFAPQPGYPVLCCAQRAYPSAEEDTCQQDGRQHPIGYRLGVETIDNGYQKDELYPQSRALYPILAGGFHGIILGYIGLFDNVFF